MPRPCRAALSGRTRGFTLIEVLVALLVFAIAVVGLVALESRSIEAQKASVEIREAERIAQDVMADLQAQGFLQRVMLDFEGNENPAFPYDDTDLDATERLRDYRRPPADIAADTNVPGAVTGRYLVVREVDWIIDEDDPPSNPPALGEDEGRIRGLTFDVTVLWIDDTNPAFPPPAGVRVTDLTREMIEPGNAAFQPFVGHVRLRTLRVNDAAVDATAVAGGEEG